MTYVVCSIWIVAHICLDMHRRTDGWEALAEGSNGSKQRRFEIACRLLTPSWQRHTTNRHSTKSTRFVEMPPTRSGYLR